MRIGLMLPATFAIDAPGNGVRVQARRQADALQRAGHDVLRLDAWQYTKAADLDVVQFYLGGFAMHKIEGLRHFAGRLLAFAPIIDSNTSFATSRLAAALGNARGPLATVPGEFRRQALASDVVIVRSAHERDRVVRGLGVEPAKVEIVLNGIDPVDDANPAEVRRRLDLPDQFVLHVSGYTQERKHVARLIEAVGPTGHPLIIAGMPVPGPALDYLRALAGRFSNVRLLPWLDEPTLHGLYAACRVFALPSAHEGTGLVALEAASLGARIVITRNGGPPDYFRDMAEYVDPFSTEDIRAAIQRAWTAPASDALRQHVLGNLTWDASAAAMVNAYQRHMPRTSAPL